MRGLRYLSIKHADVPPKLRDEPKHPDEMDFKECLGSLGHIDFRDMPAAFRKLFGDIVKRIERLEARNDETS